jgi:hypothetical protein
MSKKKKGVQAFFFEGRLGGSQRIAEPSTRILGSDNPHVVTYSMTVLGEMHMTCWPFQYFTILRSVRVVMMSCWWMLVRRLQDKKANTGVTIVNK